MDIDSIFKIYVNILIYGGTHLFSVFIAIAVIIFTMYTLRKEKFIYKIMYLLCLAMLGKSAYEIVWQWGANNVIDYNDMSEFIVSILPLIYFYYYNKQLKINRILKVNKLFVGLFVLQAIVFLAMWQTGWFDAWKLFAAGLGGDPHNLLWAIGRTNGMFMWLSLIKTPKPDKIIKT